MKLVNVGFSNYVAEGRIITVAQPDSEPVKRLIRDAKEEGRVIDVSCGKRTRSVIVTDSDHVILSSLQSETVYRRILGEADAEDEETEPVSQK